jgi:hypothetical protein
MVERNRDIDLIKVYGVPSDNNIEPITFDYKPSSIEEFLEQEGHVELVKEESYIAKWKREIKDIQKNLKADGFNKSKSLAFVVPVPLIVTGVSAVAKGIKKAIDKKKAKGERK